MTHWIFVPSAHKLTPSHGYSNGAAPLGTHEWPVWFHLARFLILIISLPEKNCLIYWKPNTSKHRVWNDAAPRQYLGRSDVVLQALAKATISRLHLCCHCSLTRGAWMAWLIVKIKQSQWKEAQKQRHSHKTCSIQSFGCFTLRCFMFLSD